MADIILVKMENEEESLNLAPPFGILFIADCLKKAGFSVQLVHEIGTQENIQAVVDLVLQEQPIFVGFSTLTGPPLRPTIQTSQEIKQRSGVPIVWGGIHPTVLPEQTLLNDFVDVVVIGEGEVTAIELANTLRQHDLQPEALEGLPGIAFKRNGQAIVTEPRPFVKDLDSIYPAWNGLGPTRYFLSQDYFLSGLAGERAVVLFTSRGCPRRCAFCYNRKVNLRTFRAQSASRVLEEIRDLRDRLDITAIIFEDDNFFTDRKRALEIVRGLDVPWNSTIRADVVARGGEEFVAELARNHCAELRIGVESGSPRILDLVCKDITLDQVRKATRWSVDHGIVTNLMFMAGFPGETWSEVIETLEFMDELEEMGDTVYVRGPFAYVPFPGTPLFELAVEHGFEPPRSLAEWSTYFFMGRQPSLPDYADKRIATISRYRELATRKDLDELRFPLPAKILAGIARNRYDRRFFSFPIDLTIRSLGIEMLHRTGFSNIVDGIRPHSH